LLLGRQRRVTLYPYTTLFRSDISMEREPNPEIPASVGMTEGTMREMYRLLAIAKYDKRYVIPSQHAEQAHSLEELATECSLNYEGGPGMGGSGPFGEGSGPGFAEPVAVENFQMLKTRQTTDTIADPASRKAKVNLLNWDGKGVPPGLFPPRADDGDRGGS